MRVGVIGYRNHARRLIGLLARRTDVTSIVVFHPDRSRVISAGLESVSPKISAAADLDALASCDAVVIASPSETHVDYLKSLAGRVRGILTEKPAAVSRAEVAWLRALSTNQRRGLWFNFNYAKTALAEHLRECISTGRLGALVHGSFAASQGLAFRPDASVNWRFRDPSPFSSIVGNLGIHYLHLVLDLFGSCRRAAAHTRAFTTAPNGVDTATIALQLENDRSVDIFLSYAAPYQNSARVVFTDGIVELNDGCVTERTPRDTFDSQGRFAAPPMTVIYQAASPKDYYDESIQRVIGDFLGAVAGGVAPESRGFDLALRSTELTLDLAAG